MLSFLKSTKNQAGFLFWGATLVQTGLQEILSHSFSWPTLITGAVAGLVAVLVPDNTALTTDAEKLVTDGLTAIASKNPAAISQILSDAAKVASDMKPVTFTASGAVKA